jgi:hypothetical protein
MYIINYVKAGFLLGVKEALHLRKRKKEKEERI